MARFEEAGPTVKFDRWYESMDSRAISRWARLELRVNTRSMMGLPYLNAPI